jgi:hypothetical protein
MSRQRRCVFKVYLTELERAELGRLGQNAGVTPSELVRGWIRDHAQTAYTNRQAYTGQGNGHDTTDQWRAVRRVRRRARSHSDG